MMRTIPNFDPKWAAQLAEFCADAYAEQISQINAAPESAKQVDYVLAADYALDGAMVTYGLGALLNDVRVWLLRAANALLEVFRLRGTMQTLPVIFVTEDEAFQPSTSSMQDYSLTNSRRGLLAMYITLISGDRDHAEQLAELVGDPPNARYIGPDSEICTPEEQQLAYAVKALLLGKIAVAAFHATGLVHADPLIRYQAAVIKAVINQDQNAFLEALEDLLQAHHAEASDELNSREPRRLICLPCLGLAILADNLVTFGQLPQDNVYMPLDLINKSNE